jgi:uncharacterized protein
MAKNIPIIKNYRSKVEHIETAWIPMKDGRQLAARLVLPKNAAKKPVPAILEYLPYRRRDGTRPRDEEVNYWFAGNGYAYVRVDISGSGDSDGLIEDEYIKREQDDALEIIAWLAAQNWCSGNVGMIGISWGGFNGLQVAARRPPALKAVISICSTVDRYNDDVHYMGGCLLNDTMDWGSVFFTIGGMPPDPEIVGKTKWRKMWKHRLDNLELYPARWMKHQRRDNFWKHGSVCEDYNKIKAPVLAVGGWADGYTSAVFDLVENMQTPCKGILGPWGHKYPHMGIPGPAIGFLQECNRWWDKWLKDIDTGVEKDPDMRQYLQDSTRPAPHHDERKGRWLGIPKWPSAKIKPERLHFGNATLDAKPSAKSKNSMQSILSPQTTGLGAGEWCAYGTGRVAPELALDQIEDDAGSLCFDTTPLKKPLNIVGRPTVQLRLSSDKPQAFVCVRLNDVRPDGTVSRAAYGILNLSHRDSHEKPTKMKPGTFYTVEVALKGCAESIPAGHKLRVAVSTSYWPMIWPSPENARITLDTARCSIDLPVLRSEAGFKQVKFAPVEYATPLKMTSKTAATKERSVKHDIEAQRTHFVQDQSDGWSVINDIGTETSFSKRKEFWVSRNDPSDCESMVTCTEHFRRGNWDARVETQTHLSSDKKNFYLKATIRTFDKGKKFIERKFDHTFKRDHM